MMVRSKLYFHCMWFWCWLCYRAYIALPIACTHNSSYGRFTLWLLGYGGAYANSAVLWRKRHKPAVHLFFSSSGRVT